MGFKIVEVGVSKFSLDIPRVKVRRVGPSRRRLWYFRRIMHRVPCSLTSALVCYTFFSGVLATASLIVSGDPIGPDSGLTDNTGGFAAVQDGGENLGHPAIMIPLSGQEFLSELRVIVFGTPSSDGNLRFDQFDYRFDVWRSADYFGEDEAEFSIVLGDPTNVTLIQTDTNTVVPESPFGSTGPGGGNATTYDLRFDLTNLPDGGLSQQFFEAPLVADDWVFGFQSWQTVGESGTLRVTGSSALVGALPLFSRGERASRGILGGQDPDDIVLHWGMSISVRDTIPGDFNLDGGVEGNDLVIWETSIGADGGADADEDGDSDGNDLLVWQRYVGAERVVPLIPGDFNGDAIVEADDLTIWERFFGVNGGADTDEDGDSDGNDFLVWQRYMGDGGYGDLAGMVPEPDAVILMLGGIFLCRWRDISALTQ